MRYRTFSLTAIWLLIGINVLLYIATSINSFINPSHQDLFEALFGLIPASFLARPWTIATALFIHANIWHILGNMITLYFFGIYLCRLIGVRNSLIIYFAGGILGNILYILLGPPNSIIIGASGAIYALAGALVIIIPNLRVLLYFIAPMPLWVVVLVFFVLWSIPGVIPDVAWQAHLGGLVFGLAAGYFFRKRGRYFL
jgi:membrane associated rhomboid family serine protease